MGKDDHGQPNESENVYSFIPHRSLLYLYPAASGLKTMPQPVSRVAPVTDETFPLSARLISSPRSFDRQARRLARPLDRR